MIAIAVDDETLMLGALTAAVEASPDISKVAQFSDCEEALLFFSFISKILRRERFPYILVKVSVPEVTEYS